MKKIFAFVLMAVLVLSLSAAAFAAPAYNVGICQLVQHPALDAATQGFQDALKEELGEDAAEQLHEEVDLLDGASAAFDIDAVRAGMLTPVFFGSALNNFGVEIFLKHFLEMAPCPSARNTDQGPVDPVEDGFSAFVFKIQANMNKAHRDRIAFIRICSGKYEIGMDVKHYRPIRFHRKGREDNHDAHL